jgi:hypothetical protein
MIDRRSLVLGLAGLLCAPGIALSAPKEKKKPFVLDPRYEPQVVDYSSAHEVGTIVVDP